MKKGLLTLLLALSLVFGCCAAASAQELQGGTITFLLTWEDEALEGGRLSLYRVADIREGEGDLAFTLIPELADMQLDLKDIEDPALAEALAERIDILEGATAPIRAGSAKFTDVAPGLYLVTQQEPVPGFEPLLPFLISMPQYENGAYVTDIIARPKSEPETPPTEPEETEPEESRPTKPDEPQLPQTGQLNWPVPVLTALGVGLFAMGWMLRRGKHYEE